MKEQEVQKTKSVQLTHGLSSWQLVWAISGTYVEQIFNIEHVLPSFLLTTSNCLHRTVEV